ncbi:MAG TPA: Dps family protein [Flavobacteriaceae bacterium]|nr:DNA starvation/stationary phase protection protein [Flavobacteriaceae bacterium]MCB9214134.1 DNA starvation/stationary phase protection protein [Alteromonas sp.]HPF11963.1 Dps family protein [Flavobacteriaceae bacterium]HQU22066.1 Dps family protein [Flavobacteriaceae bacterium]HQU65405.1 Dps family protein [Flavobacteriaceae bacterium]
MNTLNQIGLDTKKSEALSDLLNDLLANYTVFYQNVRGYHWNVRGEKFFELHVKFEELYNNLFLKIDEVAERILTLGHTPNHKASDYLKLSAIKETQEVNDGFKAVSNILSAFQTLLKKQRVLLQLSGEIDDEGTNSMMSDYIREQEKLVWMYSAFLNK